MSRLSLKPASLVALMVIVVSISSAAFKVQRVEASGTIYIRANGLVEGTDKIVTVDNVTYTFTDYINDSVVVDRGNILIDGAGFSIYVISKSECGLNLTSVTNVTIINIFITNFGYGICLSSSSNNTINGNTIAHNDCGIVLDDSSNNTLCGNLIFSNGFVHLGGIRLDSSSNNSILGNNIVTNMQNGIRLSFSSNNNSVSGNNITNSWDGIRLDYSSNNNSVSGNNITNNHHSGILLASSSNNTIYHNNFVNNTQQVSSDGTSTNVWDDGYPSGGNYWSDYNGTDANHDGIGDSAYVIDANNTDNYPLMNITPEFPSLLILPLFMTATLLAVIIYRRKKEKPKSTFAF
jgi:parallel beta-helix repeat protein